MGVPRGGNVHFKESVYKQESHDFSPSVSHRLDHEVSLQGAGRRVAGADTNDYPAGLQRTGRPDRLQMEFPDLRKRYWGRHFWARGYFSATSGNITDDVILQYLQEHEPTVVNR